MNDILRSLSERPVAYYPIHAEIMGCVSGGVFLSQLMYWFSKKDKFYKTDADIREETKLSEWELRKAKTALKNTGFISVSVEGIPAKTWYKIDWQKYAKALQDAKNHQTSSEALSKLGQRPSQNSNRGPLKTITKTTPKTTSETNNTPPASSGTIVPSEASPPNKGGNPSSLDRQRSLNKEGESVEQGESLPNKGKTRKGLPLKNVCRDENLSPVWLTEKEYNKLRNLFGRRMLEDSIESLAAYITSRGKRYKNHYAALRNWLKRETEKQPLSPEDEFIANLPPAGNYDL